MSTATRRCQRTERRTRVASLLLAGASSLRQIAEKVGCSAATVMRDVHFLEEEWSKDLHPEERVSWRAKELKKIESDEIRIRSMMQEKKDPNTGKKLPPELSYLDGLEALRKYVNERRDRILGLAATRENLDIGIPVDLSDLTDEQIRDLSAGKSLLEVLGKGRKGRDVPRTTSEG